MDKVAAPAAGVDTSKLRVPIIDSSGERCTELKESLTLAARRGYARPPLDMGAPVQAIVKASLARPLSHPARAHRLAAESLRRLGDRRPAAGGRFATADRFAHRTRDGGSESLLRGLGNMAIARSNRSGRDGSAPMRCGSPLVGSGSNFGPQTRRSFTAHCHGSITSTCKSPRSPGSMHHPLFPDVSMTRREVIAALAVSPVASNPEPSWGRGPIGTETFDRDPVWRTMPM
jgi:hypothetical protein